MARPSMGRDAKTVTATVKITAREKAQMEAAHGSTGRALRRMIDAAKDTNGIITTRKD